MIVSHKMGCSTSTDGFEVAPEKELREYLREEDVKLVQDSWKLLIDKQEEFGYNLFQRLFSQQSQMKKLFTNFMTRRVSGESVIDETLLKAHAKVVMNSLGACVECLDDSEQLTKLLIGIGERHAMHSVTPDMIPHFWPAIAYTLEQTFGEHFITRVGASWERIFRYIGSKIIEGISKWHVPDT